MLQSREVVFFKLGFRRVRVRAVNQNDILQLIQFFLFDINWINYPP